MSEVTFEVGPWKRPGNAARMVAAVQGIAKKAVADASTYRMARVTAMTLGSITVIFADEPDNEVVIEGLPVLRPKRVGQNVEIEVRNGTQFLLNRVFGDSVLLDASTADSVEPDVPTGVRVDSAARAVTVSWDPAARAVSYAVDAAKDANFTTELSTRTVTANQLIVSNLNGGDGWYYRVKALNTAGDSDYSETVSVVVDAAGGWTKAPTVPPGGIHVSPYGDRGLLSGWAAVFEAEHYEVQFSKDEAMQSGVGSHIVQGNSWLRTGLTVGDVWFHRVKAINQAGSSDWTPVVSTTVETFKPMPAGKPVKVSGVAHSTSNRAVTTVWNPQAVADYFEVERSKSAIFAEVTVIHQVQGSTLTEQNLLAGEKWYYRIRGVNLVGKGDWSDVTDVTVLSDIPAPGAPDKVVGLKLHTSPKQILAKWTAIDGTEKYEVQRSLDPNFLGGIVSEFAESNETTATDLSPGEFWNYRVRGISGEFQGAWSDAVGISVVLASEWTDGNPPENSPPVTVRAGIGQLIAVWPAQENADPVTYEVHLGMASGFIPDATTLLGITTGTQWITTTKPDGTNLDVGTTHFIRLVAYDNDGKANFGQQGSGIPEAIDLGDAGTIQYDDIKGDGFVPPTPAAPICSSGIGYLYARWIAAGGPDPLRYEVHVSENLNFVPDANTLSLVTTSLFAFIRKQGPGMNSADLEYGKIYWVKLVAVDVDGVSQPSPGGSGFTVKANTADIAVNSITAASGIIADAAVGTAKIADAAITNAKIGDLQVSTAKIGTASVTTAKISDLAVTNAKIGDLQVTTAKISDLAVTNAKIGDVAASKITTDVLFAQLTVSGAVKTANAGRRVEMNSGGLFMYDDLGSAVVSFNAASGSAFFKGNVFAVNGTFTGSISSSAVIRGGIVEGALLRSGPPGDRRIQIDSTFRNRIQFFGKEAENSESDPGYLEVSDSTDLFSRWATHLTLGVPGNLTSPPARLILSGRGASLISGVGASTHTEIIASEDGIIVNGPRGMTVRGRFFATEGLFDGQDRAFSAANPPAYIFSSSGKEGPFFTFLLDGSLRTQIRHDNNTRQVFGASTATKTFVIPHPTEGREDHYLQHAVLEGPTADVYYRGVAQVHLDAWPENLADHSARSPRAVVTLPAYFEDLTRPEGRTVVITPIADRCTVQGCNKFLPPSLAAGPVRDGKFTVYGLAGYEHNHAKFYWEVKAIRKDVEPIEAEPKREDYVLYGDGPYTYLKRRGQ